MDSFETRWTLHDLLPMVKNRYSGDLERYDWQAVRAYSRIANDICRKIDQAGLNSVIRE